MRRTRLLPLLLAAVCASGGCAPPLHAREADQLLMIQTLGFDGAPGRIRVSLSAPRETEEKDRMCLTGSGRSLIQAVRSAQQAAPREELFYSHIRFVAVGEDAARAGIGPVLDYFERGPQTRLDQPLLVVRGESAETLVAGSRDPEFEVTDMLSSLRQEAETEGSPRFYTLLETARSLADHGAALCCAVEVRPAEDAVPTAESGALTLAPVGYAVLRDGALRGFLSREEARGADLLLGRGDGLPCVLGRGRGTVTLRLRKLRTKLTPSSDEAGKPLLLVSLRAHAAIAEQDAPGESPERLEALLSEALRLQLLAALDAARRLETDYARLFSLWPEAELSEMGIARPEELLRALSAEIRAEVRLERSFDLRSAAPVRGEETP